MKYGLIKVAAAVPAVKVADVEYNVLEMEKLITLADGQNVEILAKDWVWNKTKLSDDGDTVRQELLVRS